MWRLKLFANRLKTFILDWPSCLWRLFKWILWIDSPRGKHALLRWLAGMLMLLLDLTPIPLLFEAMMDLLKGKARLLNQDEIAMIQSVFGIHFPTYLISMDPGSMIARKNKATAFVSFHTINYDQVISPHILIHECVHIWQYMEKGSVYIPEAIWAQKWGGGYNYGGLEPLIKYSEGKGLNAFNFEQQADIIEDYYRWKSGLALQWAINVPGIGLLLEKYRSELVNSI